VVQAVENWTCVTGKVLSLKHDPETGRLLVNLRLETTKPVKGFADLLRAVAGDTVAIALPAEFKAEKLLREGETVTIPARLARGPKMFAHPDWRPGEPHPLC
jgi:hypothetical protein